MADQLSFILDNARRHLDEIFASVDHHLEDEREKSEQLRQERAELATQLSQAEERENNLIVELKAERARLPECNTSPAKGRSPQTEHDTTHRHRCSDVKMLERKLQKVKDARDLTISQEWHKARRLKEQDEQLLDLQNAIGQLSEKLRQEQILVTQNSTGNDTLRQELEEVKRAAEQCEVRSKRKLAEAQAEIDAERSSWQDDIAMERKKRQRIEKSLERAKRQSESKISASQREIHLLKDDFCNLEDELRGVNQDLQQAQSSLSRRSKALTEKEHENARLMNAIETLKDSHSQEERQMRNALTNAQSDTDLAKRNLAVVSGDLEAMRQTLHTMHSSITSFAASGAVSVIRLISQKLSHFTPEAYKFCDATHGEYGFITDCGVLLCSDCLQRSVPDEKGVTDCAHSSTFFELDCPWCQSSFWTWERLTISFVSTWQRKLEEFVRCIDGWTTETVPRPSSPKDV